MRARNPWVRLRFWTLGWNVLCMAAVFLGLRGKVRSLTATGVYVNNLCLSLPVDNFCPAG